VKRTPEDEQYGKDFAERLRPFYERALAEGATESAFARRLGIDRGGLQRYLNKHATPSLRSAVLAFREFGIAIPYASVETKPLVSGVRKRKKGAEMQMDLPLAIDAPQGEIDLVLTKKSAHGYRLRFRVRKTG
jgi:transcriptional regulator with XRE-family HTH domain